MTKFTKQQQEWIDWALSAMDDDEQYPDGPPTFEQALSEPDTLVDLLYRLEAQAQDMVDDDGQSRAQAATNAAKKIRETALQDRRIS